jgi:hypothetical protein
MGEVTPSRILSLAIRKRRELVDQKEPDLCRELLNKALIHQLCKQLGERRSKKVEHRSTGKRRSLNFNDESHSKRAHFEEDEDRLVVDDSDQQGDFLCNRPSFVEEDLGACSSSMVQIEDELDYMKMERFLAADQTVIIFDFFRIILFLFQLNGYAAHWSSDSAISDADAENKSEFTHTFQTSLNNLQPTLSCPIDESVEIDPEDPLEMDALFRNLYRTIDPQQG